jgi:hypothetical protein
MLLDKLVTQGNRGMLAALGIKRYSFGNKKEIWYP